MINYAILGVTGKAPEGIDKEMIKLIVKDAANCSDALVNLIILITGKERGDKNARWTARNIATLIIRDFNKDNSGLTWDSAALAVISAYFANPKLVTVSLLKIMMNKMEKAD